jgi:hypothetical protein
MIEMRKKCDPELIMCIDNRKAAPGGKSRLPVSLSSADQRQQCRLQDEADVPAEEQLQGPRINVMIF